MFPRLLENILKSDGHRVTTARNGVEALARLTEDVFALTDEAAPNRSA